MLSTPVMSICRVGQESHPNRGAFEVRTGEMLFPPNREVGCPRPPSRGRIISCSYVFRAGGVYCWTARTSSEQGGEIGSSSRIVGGRAGRVGDGPCTMGGVWMDTTALCGLRSRALGVWCGWTRRQYVGGGIGLWTCGCGVGGCDSSVWSVEKGCGRVVRGRRDCTAVWVEK